MQALSSQSLLTLLHPHYRDMVSLGLKRRSGTIRRSNPQQSKLSLERHPIKLVVQCPGRVGQRAQSPIQPSKTWASTCRHCLRVLLIMLTVFWRHKWRNLIVWLHLVFWHHWIYLTGCTPFTRTLNTNWETIQVFQVMRYFFSKINFRVFLFWNSFLHAELSSNSVEPLLDHGERYLTRLMYRKFFCPPNCDDEERDLAVQKRIRGLNWISAPLLDCKINELDPKVRDILEKAITRTIFVFIHAH